MIVKIRLQGNMQMLCRRFV